MTASDTFRQHDVPVRGTQRLVDTLFRCWKRPSLTALEVAWRWAYGIPALALLWHEGMHIVRTVPLQYTGITHMSLLDPMQAAQVIANVGLLVLPPLLKLSRWLVPLLIVSWAVVSGLGRTVVLWRVQQLFPEMRPLRTRPFTHMALQLVRSVALGSSFVLWFMGLQWAAQTAITANLEANQDPNLVLYSALVIILSLGMFTLWAMVSWVFSAAPLLAATQGTGVSGSLLGTVRLGELKSKLVEINLVLGIVKLALVVLAMVFSATPLPFESVATDAFLHVWWVTVTVLYFVASDFFHVARLVAYLELWRVYLPRKDFPISVGEI